MRQWHLCRTGRLPLELNRGLSGALEVCKWCLRCCDSARPGVAKVFVVCSAACAGVKQRALANCAGGRCDCAGFVAKRGRASGWLWRSLCLMLDGSWWEGIGIRYADANGNDWNVSAARTTRTLRHLLLLLQGSGQPYHHTTLCCATRPKASTLPAPPATPALTSSLTTRHTLYRCPRHPRRPFLHFLLHPLNNHLSRRRRALLQHRPPRRHLHVTAPPNPIREVSYVCSSYYAFTFTLLARSEMSSLAGRGRGKIRPPRRVSHHRQPHSPRVVSTYYTCYTTFISTLR